jgi:hypothetical protein
MTTGTPCRVRDGVGFLEPTAIDREPLQVRGVHTLNRSKGHAQSLPKGSLRRMRGTHLRGQVHEETSTRHQGGGFFFLRFPAAVPVRISPQA